MISITSTCNLKYLDEKHGSLISDVSALLKVADKK